MISAQTKLIQHPRTAARVIEGKAVVIVIDNQKLHTFNEVGTFIWNQANRPITAHSIAKALCNRFDIDEQTSLNDTLQFANHLHKIGALTLEEETS